ncbi:MAG: pyruvate kinase [Akkermansiaceae bacterium]|nr:pyruvate kinase [Akkermansiaceae bacterium]
MRRSRLIATLGPATESNEAVADLIDAGADTFRINMSHAAHDWARDLSGRIRKIADNAQRPVGILFDLQGPSIRTGDLEEVIELKKGDQLEFRQRGTDAKLDYSTTVNYDGLVDDVSAGDTLIVDNGALIMKIAAVEKDRIVCEVTTAGTLGSRRHINLPGVRLTLPALTEKDRKDLKLAIECEADYIAGSFVRDESHVTQLREAIEAAGGHAQLISKVEDQEAVRNIDDIIMASDLIMVARGDLGIEVHIEELPILQRRIVKRCLRLGRRVIVATHLLESMISNPTPTRAEVTDCANAVYEEADALMLSGETSVGRHAVRALQILDRVARRIERSGGLGYGSDADLRSEKGKAVRAAVNLADSISNALVVVFTRSGKTANRAALLRPRSPIYAFTPSDEVCRSLCLSRGVRPFQIDFRDKPRHTIAAAVEVLRSRRDIPAGTTLIIVSDTLHEDHAVDSILVEHA